MKDLQCNPLWWHVRELGFQTHPIKGTISSLWVCSDVSKLNWTKLTDLKNWAGCKTSQSASRQMGQHIWADVYPILKAFLSSIFFSGQNILPGKLKLQIQTCQVVQTTSWDNRVVFLSLCTFYEKKGTYHRGCCKHCVRTKLGLWCTGLPLGGWHAIKKNGIQAMQLSSQRLLTNFHPVFFF